MRYLFLFLLFSCGSIDVRDSRHEIEIKNFCDEKTFPNPVERRACVEKLLDILDD